MITGYNHNVRHQGRIYHIQTEDSGIQYAHIITHLFVGGNIISSKKSSYDHLLGQGFDEERLEKEIQDLMKEQHKDMMRELKGGSFDHIGTFKKEGESLSPGEGGVTKVRNTSMDGPQVGGIGGLPSMSAAAADAPVVDLDSAGADDSDLELEQSLEAMMSDIDSLLTDDDVSSRSTRESGRQRSSRRGRERPTLGRERPSFSSSSSISPLSTKGEMPTIRRPELNTGSVAYQSSAAPAEKPSERLRAQRRERPSLDLRPPSSPSSPQVNAKLLSMVRSVLDVSSVRADVQDEDDIARTPEAKVQQSLRGWDLRDAVEGMVENAQAPQELREAVASFLQRNPAR